MVPANNGTNNSDYEHLLQRVGSQDDSVSQSGSTVAQLNLDHLTHQKQKMLSPVKKTRKGTRQRSTNYSYYGRKMSFWEFASSYVSIMCLYYPKACGCLTIVVLLAIMTLLASLIWNPTEEYGHIHHDHSNIKSKYDLSMANIDSWCLGGGNDRCRCEDPLVPLNRVEYKSWTEAFKANRKMLKRYQDPLNYPEVDVAFLGESIGTYSVHASIVIVCVQKFACA
jgi:hypothetical protein